MSDESSQAVSSGLDESELPKNIRTGLAAIREVADDSKDVFVEARYGNFVFVNLGEWPVADLNKKIETERAEVIVRVPMNFPSGQLYGVITIPPLQTSGALSGNPTRGHQHAKPVERTRSNAEAQWWSWNWNDAHPRTARDMKLAVLQARDCLRSI